MLNKERDLDVTRTETGTGTVAGTEIRIFFISFAFTLLSPEKLNFGKQSL